MSRMGEIHLMVSEMFADGMGEEEIAQVIAKDFDVDEDFALNLVEDISDKIDDGQPSLYEEYQDLYGGDDSDHGQYEEF